MNPFRKLKPLTPNEITFLQENLPLYDSFTKKEKDKFHERLSWFRTYKKFVFYGKQPDKEQLKLLIAGIAILLTMGFKDYKMSRALLRIIVYPTQYFSRIKRRHHFGEYNPRLKSLIFAADRLKKGFEIADDNLNLGVHEFAHALSFDLSRKRSWEARKFRLGLRRMYELIAKPDFKTRMEKTTYFREYSKTNIQEFFAVVTENYLETPEIFQKEFPQLYVTLKKMLNYEFLQANH